MKSAASPVQLSPFTAFDGGTPMRKIMAAMAILVLHGCDGANHPVKKDMA
jgi:hypothetical protein